MSCGMPATIRCASRELAQERQAAGRRRRVDRARDEEAVASLLERPRGRDQRAAAGRRLDHDRRIGQPADDPVAARERALGSARRPGRARTRSRRPPRRSRRPAGCGRADGRSPWPDPMTATVVPPAWTRRGVGRTVDADREPRHDARPDRRRGSSAIRAAIGPAGIGRPARADDRDRRLGARAPRDRRARTARAAASRSRPSRAGIGRILEGHDRAGRARGSAPSVASGRLGRASAIAVGHVVARRDRAPVGPPSRSSAASRPGAPVPPGDAASRRIATRCRSAPAAPRTRPVRARGRRPGPPTRRARSARAARRRERRCGASGRRGRLRRATPVRPVAHAEHVSRPRRRRAACRPAGTRPPRRGGRLDRRRRPARSAIVRATRSSRSVPRPLARSSSARCDDAPLRGRDRAGTPRAAHGPSAGR